ncbi:uncharacterized protein LOC132564269 [Ylistrum balloti]|uniref:uncharacterized protein LOC132564269 n=1 Tax=Ylistrum balloti TaxID=509963 RepID=UPI0029059C97|nr:uncharacterized protein LOC132564269 [Ylistrum balloti]
MKDVLKTAHFLAKHCGVKSGDHIGLICDNRKEWLECDLSILSLGAVDVPRGTDTKLSEIAFILQHAKVKGVIFENIDSFLALNKECPAFCKKLKFIIIIDPATKQKITKVKTVTKIIHYADIAKTSISSQEEQMMEKKIEKVELDDIATIIYTSGTTNEPKGACITHRNFLFQIDRVVPERISLNPKDILLTILPIWHIFEREVNYITICVGAGLAYSKPIGSVFLEDIKNIQPSFLTSVPRIWEGVYQAVKRKVSQGSPIKKLFFASGVFVGKMHSYIKHLKNATIPAFTPANRIRFIEKAVGYPLYYLLFPIRAVLDLLVFKKIRKLLGPNFKCGISGGGSLVQGVDDFFQAANIKLLNGYGLTETSPVLAVRNEYRPEYNGVGKILKDVEYKVLDEYGYPVKAGKKGVLHVKCDQVMAGYYNNPKATSEVLSKDGWLNTGDIVVMSPKGDIKIIGREKNTIVLSNGKNIEPEFVENTVLQSPYIDNVVVLGQDKKFLSALIVPNKEMLQKKAQELGIVNDEIEVLYNDQQIRNVIQSELEKISRTLSAYEKILQFTLIHTSFTVGKELTQTLKIKRYYIHKEYAKEIQKLLAN